MFLKVWCPHHVLKRVASQSPHRRRFVGAEGRILDRGSTDPIYYTVTYDAGSSLDANQMPLIRGSGSGCNFTGWDRSDLTCSNDIPAKHAFTTYLHKGTVQMKVSRNQHFKFSASIYPRHSTVYVGLQSSSNTECSQEIRR